MKLFERIFSLSTEIVLISLHCSCRMALRILVDN